MSNVFMRVGPTMLFPLLAAWLIQYAAPKVNAVLLRWAFWLLPVGGDARHPYGRHL